MLEPFSATLLLLTCFWVPLLAFKSAQRLGDGPLPISRRRFFIQTVVLQAAFATVAVVASQRTGVPLGLVLPKTATSWLAGVGLVIIGVAALRWRWASRASVSKQRLYSILPHSAAEFPPYLVLCLAAGVCEEIIYRGMLLSILRYLTGSLIAGILIAAVAFALAHALQGGRGMVAIFVIALIAHGLVLYSRSLLPVMAAHTVYDAIAGWLIPRWYERDVTLERV